MNKIKNKDMTEENNKPTADSLKRLIKQSNIWKY